MKAWTIGAWFGLFAAGCAVGVPPTADRTVEMLKPEQSLQCEPGSGVTEAELRTELAEMGITVLAYRRGHDGMAYPAVCGAPTGHVHVFTVEPGDVAAAEVRGYKRLRE